MAPGFVGWEEGCLTRLLRMRLGSCVRGSLFDTPYGGC